MLRRFIFSAILGTGLLTGLALTPTTASANPIPVPSLYHPDFHGRYAVFYRHGPHWERYATYRDRDDAQRAARLLRHQGYLAKVERQRG